MSIVVATQAHVSDLARVHLASKLAAETGLVDPEYLTTFTQEGYEEKWREWVDGEDSYTFMAYEADMPVGFISFGKLRTPPPGTSKIRPLYSSEVYAVYVHPDCFQKGHGKALLQHAVETLRENNHKSLCLWAIDKNKRACDFYAAMKGERIGKQVVEMGRSRVKELCYGWRDISVITAL